MAVGIGGIFFSSVLVAPEDIFAWGSFISWLAFAGIIAALLIRVFPTQCFSCTQIMGPSYRTAMLIILTLGVALTIARIISGGLFIGVPWMSSTFDHVLNQVLFSLIPAFCFAIAAVFTRLVVDQKRWVIGALLVLLTAFLTMPFGKRFYLIFFSAVVVLSLVTSHDKKSTIKPIAILLICGLVIAPINNWVRNIAYFSYATTTESYGTVECKNEDILYPIFECSLSEEYQQKWGKVVPTFFNRLKYSRDTIQFLAKANESFSFDSENLIPSIQIIGFGYDLIDDVNFLIHENKLNEALGRRAEFDGAPTVISDAIDIFGYAGSAIFYGTFLAVLSSLALPFLQNYRLTTVTLFGSYFYILAWPEEVIGIVASNLRFIFLFLIIDFFFNKYWLIFSKLLKSVRTDILIFFNHYLIIWICNAFQWKKIDLLAKDGCSPVQLSAKSLVVIYIHREDSWEFDSLPECLKSFARVEVVLHDKNGFEGLISIGEKYRADHETILITCLGIRQGLNRVGLEKIKRTFTQFLYFNLDDKRSFLFFDYGEITGPAVISRYADVVLTSERESVKKYRLFGAAAKWFPEGANVNIFRPLDVAEKRLDVVFVGAAYGWRKDLIAYLRASLPGLSIVCWGNGWDNGRISLEEVNQVINSAKIVLGHGGIGWSKTETHLKGRDFEVLVSGAVYLTSFNKDLIDLAENDQFIFTYRSFKECRQRVLSVLDSELNVPSMIVDQRRLKHSWVRRFEQVFIRV